MSSDSNMSMLHRLIDDSLCPYPEPDVVWVTKEREIWVGLSQVLRFEREVQLMKNLLEGYRKALKATQKTFAEHRAHCPQAVEPLCRDRCFGIGGPCFKHHKTGKATPKARRRREDEQDW